ncbi:MAG: thiamine-binding protein [Cyclobacteriaceae bacterium]
MTNHHITLGIQIVPKSSFHETYDLVDAAIEVIQNSSVKHQITPFETVMEGPHDQLMKISKQAQQAVLDAGADECLVYYRIHYRKDGPVTFEEKRLDR